MVSDKEVGGRQGYGRLIPLGHFVVQELQKFIDFYIILKLKLLLVSQKFHNIFNKF